jgi:hypothetical protein
MNACNSTYKTRRKDQEICYTTLAEDFPKLLSKITPHSRSSGHIKKYKYLKNLHLSVSYSKCRKSIANRNF